MKNVEEKTLSFLLVKNLLRFEKTGTTLLKITGRRTCYSVLLIRKYVTLVKSRRK